MAATAVQGTPELLEMILMELPVKDILLAQRVSKGWKDTITGSKKIQRALFLLPVFEEPMILQDYRTKKGTKMGCWLSRWVLDGSLGSGLPFTVYKNPLLQPLLTAASKWSGHKDFTDGMSVAWTRPDASWRDMLVTQPPIEGDMRVIESDVWTQDLVLLTKDDRAGTFVKKAIDPWRGKKTKTLRRLRVDGWDLWEKPKSGDEVAILHHKAMALKKQGLWPGE